MENILPNQAQKQFLTLAYNRFYDLFEEIFSDNFWSESNNYRFHRIKLVFDIYAELLNYGPIRWVIQTIKVRRPPMEAEISKELFKFIRNCIVHFPFFDNWNDVWITREIVNWDKEGQSIDKFLIDYEGHEPVKYRFWESEKKQMTYITINFPIGYINGNKIFLKDILSEKDGTKFSII